MTLLRRVIGAVLRRARHRQGRTLRDVALAAGVSLPCLSEVERGTKEASSEVLAAICRALGLPLPDLLDEVRREMLREAAVSMVARRRPAPAAGRAGDVRCALSGARHSSFAGTPVSVRRWTCAATVVPVVHVGVARAVSG